MTRANRRRSDWLGSSSDQSKAAARWRSRYGRVLNHFALSDLSMEFHSHHKPREMHVTHRNAKFANTVLEIDGEVYDGCDFEDCTLQYAGGAPPIFTGCSFGHNQFQMVGAAERTVQYLKLLNVSGMSQLVSQMFKEIKEFKLPQRPQQP